MFDSKAAVSAAVKQLIDSVDGGELSTAASSGTERLLRLRGVWEAARAEVKDRLEGAIESLSEQEFPTLAEKEHVSAHIQEEIERWGFVAVAPHTGLPAYLRAKDAPKNPRGFFYFDPLPNVAPVLPPDESAQATGVRLPRFKLTDLPSRS